VERHIRLNVCRGAFASAFARFSIWLDSKKNWEQNLVVGVMLLVISAFLAAAWRLCIGILTH